MPYKVLFIAVDSEALDGAELSQAVVADMDIEGVNRPPTAREGAIIAAIAKTMDERDLTKAISFHSRNANAERFVQYAGAMFEERQLDISLERVDGKMSTEERGKKMEDFGDASEPMIMANARCLQEGVDVPALDLAILVDPKYSMVDIAQLVGRVMRTSDGKTEGYVLVPIFVEGGESPQGVVASSADETGEAGEDGRREAGDGEGRRTKRQRQSSDEDEASEESEGDSEGPDDPPDAAHGRYKVAVAVLRALMQHDDQLAATLRAIRVRAGREGRLLTREEVESDFPYFCERVDISALEDRVSLDTLWAAVGTLVELSTDTWDEHFGELQAYQARFSNCNVPREWRENPQLGRWVTKQRREKRKFDQGAPSQITQGRIERLNSIGFEWDPVADLWEQRFGELQAYQADKGDCNVPRRWSVNSQLGTWVDTQRTEKRKFDKGDERAMITPERIERLDGIGFEWEPVADVWGQRFRELQAYQADKGHCNVPQQWPENKQLGMWVNKQRAEKRKLDQGKRSSITQPRIERLNGIGFEWNARKGGAAQRQQRHGASASRCLDAPRSPTRGAHGDASQPATSLGSRQRPLRPAGEQGRAATAASCHQLLEGEHRTPGKRRAARGPPARHSAEDSDYSRQGSDSDSD